MTILRLAVLLGLFEIVWILGDELAEEFVYQPYFGENRDKFNQPLSKV